MDASLEEEQVLQHLGLVKTLAGRLAISLPAHVDAADLYSAGLVGLVDAIRNYDPIAGSTFESYARVRIRGAMIDELRRLDWVPRSVHDKARKVEETIRRLEQERGEIPTVDQIAAFMGLSLQDCEKLLEEVRPATFICLDAVCGTEGGDDRHEWMADASQPDPSERAERRELAELILLALRRLPEAQRKVLALYYFEDLRLREIAQVLGVTESRICQIHTQAILSIRALLPREPGLVSVGEALQFAQRGVTHRGVRMAEKGRA